MSLTDRYGRRIRYLRLSLTGACPMRCVYCRPATAGEERSRPILTAGEIEVLVRYLVETHDLRKVRLTGGEPTARPDLLDIVRRLAAIQGLEDLAMTTNGLTLAADAGALAEAGLRRVNVSLDSLNHTSFWRITGVDGLRHVLAGIKAAVAAGLAPLKLNTVVLRPENVDELPDLLCFAAASGVEIRFIELMPMGPLAGRWAERFVSVPEMHQALHPIVEGREELPTSAGSAHRYRLTLVGGRQVVAGFIAPMSCPFCMACDRIRIGADGTLYPCLMERPAGSVLAAVRPKLNAAVLARLLARGLSGKAPVHPAAGREAMVGIGG